MSVSVKIEGMEALDRALRNLPDRVQKKVVKKALRAGGNVIVRKARGLAPKKSGKLKKGIKFKAGKTREGALGFVTTTGDAYYAHMVEFGTQRHALGKGSSVKSGKQTGRIHPGQRPRRFMSPAFNSTHTEQLQKIGEVLAKGIIEEAKKL